MNTFETQLLRFLEFMEHYGMEYVSKDDLESKFEHTTLNSVFSYLREKGKIVEMENKVRLLPGAFDILMQLRSKNTPRPRWRKYLTKIIMGVIVGVIVGLILYFIVGQDGGTSTVNAANNVGVGQIVGNQNTVSVYLNSNSTSHPNETRIGKSPISIEVIYDIETENVGPTLSKLRSARLLRSLEVIETGRTFVETPSKTYFFVYSFGLEGPSVLNRATVDRENQGRGFELHKLSKDEVYVIGFTNRDTASRISLLDGMDEKEVTLFPYPFEEYDALASIPFSRLTSAKERRITDDEGFSIYILDTKIQ